MEGSQPGTGIDPQMIRDHGAHMEDLEKEIRDIEAEALNLQARLAQAQPMPSAPNRRHRWGRTA